MHTSQSWQPLVHTSNKIGYKVYKMSQAATTTAAATAAASNSSRQSNNRVSFLVRHKPLVVHGLVANVVYFFGAAAFVVFASLELNGRERDTAALMTYSIAFVSFLCNAFGELYIDLTTGERAVRHGRYSTKNLYNIAIGLLFVAGTVLDTAAFFLWIQRAFVTEHRVLYASSHAWLVSGILALIGQVPFVDSFDAMEVLDDIGNFLFFVGCVIDCVVRYTDTEFATGNPPPPVAKLEFSSSPLWLASAMCYIAADVMRVHRIRSNKILQQSLRQTSPPVVPTTVP